MDHTPPTPIESRVLESAGEGADVAERVVDQPPCYVPEVYVDAAHVIDGGDHEDPTVHVDGVATVQKLTEGMSSASGPAS